MCGGGGERGKADRDVTEYRTIAACRKWGPKQNQNKSNAAVTDCETAWRGASPSVDCRVDRVQTQLLPGFRFAPPCPTRQTPNEDLFIAAENFANSTVKAKGGQCIQFDSSCQIWWRATPRTHQVGSAKFPGSMPRLRPLFNGLRARVKVWGRVINHVTRMQQVRAWNLRTFAFHEQLKPRDTLTRSSTVTCGGRILTIASFVRPIFTRHNHASWRFRVLGAGHV